MRRIVVTVALVGLIAAACGGGITPAQADLANVEGRWMCDVQRYTFAELADVQSELEARVAAAGYTTSDYESFKAALAEDQDLRIMVRDVYEEYCA